MKHLIHLKDKIVYIRAESLCWFDGELLYQPMVKGSKIVDIFKKIFKDYDDYLFVIDCKRVTEFDINFLRELYQFLSDERHNHELVFVRNSTPDLNEKLQAANFRTNYSDDKKIVVSSIPGPKIQKSDLVRICDEYLQYIKYTSESYIKNTFSLHDPNDESKYKLLHSTPLFSNGEFDAGKIISDPKKFLMTATYASDLLESYLVEKQINSTSKTKFLAVNLRSTPFANAYANLLGYDLYTIDHLGPNHKLFNIDFNRKYFDPSDYVYIGDFLMGGTEVKIAQNYIQFLGGKLEHAFVLGSYFEEDEERFNSRFDFRKIISLQNIDKFKVKI